MRFFLAASLIAAASLVLSGEQAALDARLRAQLQQLFPAAATFSSKEGEPPHFKAYVGAPGSGPGKLVGLAFWTTELEPLERGYDGPIQVLVGLETTGRLAGIIVVAHREPYGDFSIDPPSFAAQFRGKNIRDPFRVGADIHAVSRATITVSSATRAVRNSARRIARQLLTPPAEP
jgi:NosR/NirI family nitrous oxide reductase transcriptional regulator